MSGQTAAGLACWVRLRKMVGMLFRRLVLFPLAAALVGAALTLAARQAQGQETPQTEPPPPAYDERLLRLAEILGALHFLRPLCGYEDGGAWKADMEALLSGESPSPLRRARMVARFNHGFETYHAGYRSCTPSARRAIALYLDEGGRIAADVAARYGQ